MKKPLRPSFYWKAPCLVLVAFIFFHSKAWLIAKAWWPGFGPFTVSVADVEAVEMAEMAPGTMFEGYDRQFQTYFDVSGRKPNWWGMNFYYDDDKAMHMDKWSFWLERRGKRIPFRISKGFIGESYWNDERQCYSNDFLFHSGAVPTDAALKVRALIQLVPKGYNNPDRFSNIDPLPPPCSVVLTLKKAGEKWK